MCEVFGCARQDERLDGEVVRNAQVRNSVLDDVEEPCDASVSKDEKATVAGTHLGTVPSPSTVHLTPSSSHLAVSRPIYSLMTSER